MSITIDDLEEVEILGRGRYGVVAKCKCLFEGVDYFYACKIIDISPDIEAYVNREIETFSRITHPNIVTYYYHDIRETSPYMKQARIIMEHCEGSDVFIRVIKEKILLDYSIVTKWLRQMAEAISYLHFINVIHRDFKAANILLTDKDFEKAEAKLCDFGVSKYIGDANVHGRIMTRDVGTLKYYSPEQFTQGYDFKVDVWALGIFAHELFTGEHPFEGDEISLKNKHQALQNSSFQVKAAPVHPIVQNFIMQCFIYDPNLRPSIGDLLEHPLFSGQDLTPPEASLPVEPPRPVIDIAGLCESSLRVAQMNLQFIADMERAFGPDVARKIAIYYKADLYGLIDTIGELSESQQCPESQQWKENLQATFSRLNPFLRR